MTDPFITLDFLSRKLARQLHALGIERTPDQVADALLAMSEGFTLDAIGNGYQYATGKRDMAELVCEVSMIFPVRFDHECN